MGYNRCLLNISRYLAHGAFVGIWPADVESPGGAGPPGWDVAQGALVGAIGPGGCLDVLGTVKVGALGTLVVNPGAFVLAHGALVPGPSEDDTVEASSVLRVVAAI